jgi:hypothetical protein
MADEKRGAFTISEHWIRAPLNQKRTVALNAAGRTTIVPRHLFLRLMIFNDREKASDIQRQLSNGGSFLDLARANSVDPATAEGGGYLGDVETAQLDPAWSSAALPLEPGETSPIIEANGKYFIVQRMSRTFRQEAEAVFNSAMDLRKQGRVQDSSRELLGALKLYPRLLRALTYLGIEYGEGEMPRPVLPFSRSRPVCTRVTLARISIWALHTAHLATRTKSPNTSKLSTSIRIMCRLI